MERESGETTRALLVDNEVPAGINGHGRNGGEAANSSSPSTTAIVFFSTFVAISGQFSFGCASAYTSPVESAIMEELGLSTTDYSIFASILSIGGMLGAIISGKVTDVFGRKWAMWLSDVFCIIGWLAILFAQDVWWLDIGRFSMGIGFGILGYVTYIYVAEITPKNVRGGLSSANVMMLCCGTSLILVVGNIFSWRALTVFGILPSILQLVGLFFVPESPRWLAKVGKERELEAALRRLRGDPADIHEELVEIMDNTKIFEQLSKGRIFDLLDRRYAYSLFIGNGILLLRQLGGYYGILFYASSIFEAAGASATVGTIAMAIIQIPFTIPSIVLVDKCGRRPLLMISAAGTAVSNIIAALGFLLQELHHEGELASVLVLSGILLYNAAFAAGMNGTPWILTSEIYPINIRGAAGSLGMFSNYLSAWIVSFIFNFVFEWTSSGIFFIFAAMCGLTVVFVAKLVPETKGRSLEEIQESLTRLRR
ncbi:hypothetical protein NMG60_11020688 [Bertholletia excelsa]